MKNLYEILGIKREDIQKDADESKYDRKKLIEIINNFNNNNIDVQRNLNNEIEKLIELGLDGYDYYVYERQNDELIDMVNDKHPLSHQNFDVIDQRGKKEKKKKVFTIVRDAILVGAIVAVGVGATTTIANRVEKNKNSNVCVQCQVQEGDTLSSFEDYYDLHDIGNSNLAISGFERQQVANNLGQDITRFVAAGDVIIGRTTLENARKLVEEKGARIISIEEAVELLGENNSLVGEFKKYAEGNSNMVFYVSEEKSIG